MTQTIRAAYDYVALPESDPRRPGLRGDYLAALARHHEIKRELIPLIAGWREAGIDALLFKGFHLSEFIYPAPGMRFHGDVDVAIRAEHARAALDVAGTLGWNEDHNSFELGNEYSHGICNLHLPGGATKVDLHRFVIHSRWRITGVQRLITNEIWNRSARMDWGGGSVRLPDPVDALLILVLQRAWGDGWLLKPHDAPDVQMLTDRVGDGWRGALEERARTLGCVRTTAIFLKRFDSGGRLCTLAQPSRSERRRWNLAVLGERPAFSRMRFFRRLPKLPFVMVDVAAALPWVLRVRRALRAGGDIRDLLRSLTPRVAPSPPPPYTTRHRAVRGIRWGTWLIRRHPGGVCLVRSLAIYAALRRQGWPVEFVSGVTRADEGFTGHAWIELDGQVLPELNEPLNGVIYQVNVRYPGTGA